MHMLNLLGSWQHAGTERHSPLVMGGVLDVWLAGATATFILCRLFAIRPPFFDHFFSPQLIRSVVDQKRKENTHPEIQRYDSDTA